MIKLKSKQEIDRLRIGGAKLAKVLAETAKIIRPGVTTAELDEVAHASILRQGAKPSFLNYRPGGARRAFPSALCVCLNDGIVHGEPNENPREIRDGDLVTIDAGLIYDGLFSDAAMTVVAGKILSNEFASEKEIRNLLTRTQEALNAGIKQARVGNRIGDITAAIERVADDAELTVVEDLAGHGVGFAVHEEPFVPNSGLTSGQGELIEEGLVIAIEPMFTLGDGRIILDRDGFTYRTRDGSLATQFEHTIAVTSAGPIVLTACK